GAPHFPHIASIRVLPCLTATVFFAIASLTRRSASSRIDCFDISGLSCSAPSIHVIADIGNELVGLKPKPVQFPRMGPVPGGDPDATAAIAGWAFRLISPAWRYGENAMIEKKVPYQVDGRQFEGVIVYDDGVTTKRPAIFMQPDWKGVCADTIA